MTRYKLVPVEATDWLRENALFSCQDEGCKQEVSYPADMLRLWQGKPICEGCFDDVLIHGEFDGEGNEIEAPLFSDLKPFDPYTCEAAPSPWRPIEEAEEYKDGQRLLVVDFTDGVLIARYHLGYWYGHQSLVRPTHFIPLSALGIPGGEDE